MFLSISEGSWHEYFQKGIEPQFTNKSLIWSIKRQTWLIGPKIDYPGHCPVSINRSSVAFLGFNGIELYDFESMNWTHVTNLNMVPHSKYTFGNLVCTLIHDKNYDKLIFAIQYSKNKITELIDNKKDMVMIYNLDQNTVMYQEFVLGYRGKLKIVSKILKS